MGIPVEQSVLYWKTDRCNPNDTPSSIGLSEKELNKMEICRYEDPNLNTIDVKWQLKDRRAVSRRIKKVSGVGGSVWLRLDWDLPIGLIKKIQGYRLWNTSLVTNPKALKSIFWILF